MGLKETLYNFHWEIAEANRIIEFAYSESPEGVKICDELVREVIINNTLLKIFIAWEAFLENSFLGYMMGEVSISGKSAILYAQPEDANHANEMLRGSQKFVDWSTPDNVRRISKVYFRDGAPFYDVIGDIHSDILDLKTIRNAAAHLSSTTQSKLNILGNRKLNTISQSYTVGTLILEIDPNGTNYQTVLDSYIEILTISAEKITNW